MPCETKGQPSPKPWYVPAFPWAFWGDPTNKKMFNNGTKPQDLLTAAQAQLGFAVSPSFSVGTNAMANGPATVGNVLNVSAAAFGSSGAWERLGPPGQ